MRARCRSGGGQQQGWEPSRLGEGLPGVSLSSCRVLQSQWAPCCGVGSNYLQVHRAMGLVSAELAAGGEGFGTKKGTELWRFLQGCWEC